MSRDVQIFRSEIHPDRKAQFQAVATSKREVKNTRSKSTMCCTNCGKIDDDEGDKLKQCSSVSLLLESLYKLLTFYY
jgi:hypothetical protein